MNRDRSREIASSFIDKIDGTYERLEIAGSIRRGKQEVNDIEIVVMPKMGQRAKAGTLFDPVTAPEYTLSEEFNMMHDVLTKMLLVPSSGLTLDRFAKDGKKPPFGPRFYRLTYEGEKLDLFAVLPPADWGVIYTIRTGSKDYSKWLMIQALAKGMRVKDGQLLRELQKDREYEREKLGEVIMIGDTAYEVLACPGEIDFFDNLGMKMPEPKDREMPS